MRSELGKLQGVAKNSHFLFYALQLIEEKNF